MGDLSDHVYDITIVGGGIVGAATMYSLQERYPELHILLLEKEDHLAAHQTGHNSGVIHSGLYYKPGSSKAAYCVSGRHALVKFAREHHIPHDICGKVVVATEARELPHLERIFANGLANNTEGIEKIDGGQIKEIEPYCAGFAGIWVPCTGIIDFPAATQKMVEIARQKQPDSRVQLDETFKGAQLDGNVSLIRTSKSTYKSKYVIYCAGLQADRLAEKQSVDLDLQIVGFRGDYYELANAAKHKVKNLIYPVPDPAFPFLGVHFTRMIHGGVECGPNAVFTFEREGYEKTSFNWRDTLQSLSYGGTWNLFRKHWKFGLNEYRRAFSKKRFLHTLQRLIPDLTMNDIVPGRAGVRAMALGADGNMIEDFRIAYKENGIHVLNAPSPAATASLAIGEAVTSMAGEHFELDQK